MEEYLRNLPKIELHAHLNGSLNIKSILELGEMLYGSNSDQFLQLSQEFINFKKDCTLEDCFKKFKFMHELTATRRGLAAATELVIRDFAADNVIYVELRTHPKDTAEMTKRQYLTCVLETISEHKYDSIKVKLLPSLDRGQPDEVAEQNLDLVLELREQYEGVIVGIDLSGNPELGKFEDFKPVLSRARDHGLQLALHCGEIENRTEIAEMLEFGMERCGHGTFLSREQLTQLVQSSAAIECCLTSNVKCQTVRSYKDHHLQHLIDVLKGVVLCTDDCGVFDTTLTQEFLRAVDAFDLDIKQIQQLVLNATEHAFLPPAEREELRQIACKYFSEQQL